MEVLVKPVKDIKEYSKADGFVLPLKDFSVDYRNYYSIDDIKSIKENTNKKIFIVMNKMIQNDEIKKLEDTLKIIDSLNIDGVFFYDLCFLELKEELKLKVNFVWNNTHMVTNYFTCNYYYDKGCNYAYLSNELTLDEILEINKKSNTKNIVMLLGYPVASFSRRKLVTNSKYSKEVKIKEPVSSQEYIVFENEFGTTFKYNKIRNNARVLDDFINNNIDYILMIEDDIDHGKFIEGLELTKEYIENKNDYYVSRMRELFGSDTGFLYRKTIYKVKK